MTTITPIRCTIGQPATGSDCYFQRPLITQRIRRAIDNGENILISAPRRIGKSSVLYDFMSRPAENEVIKYLSVQSVTGSNEFFQQLFKLLIRDTEIFAGVDSYYHRSSTALKGLISRFQGISLEGLKVFRDENIDYFTELCELIEEFQNKKIVILVDEFPDSVNNLIRKDEDLAIDFLLKVRELRQISSRLNLQFIFTGSSGLANIVSQLGKDHLINDLYPVAVTPYSKEEATAFIQCLVLGYQEDQPDFRIDSAVIAHILNKITWRLPYYLQILVKELFESFESTQQQPGIATIDQVMIGLVKARSHYHGFFKNWQVRLERSFDENTQQVAIEILNQLATENVSSLDQIKSLTFSVEPTQSIKHILNVLEHDGYISENQKQYGFNSFLLKQWWLEHVAE